MNAPLTQAEAQRYLKVVRTIDVKHGYPDCDCAVCDLMAYLECAARSTEPQAPPYVVRLRTTPEHLDAAIATYDAKPSNESVELTAHVVWMYMKDARAAHVMRAAHVALNVENVELREIVRRGIANACRPIQEGPTLAWVLVMDVFGHGSRRSKELCKEFGVDPERQIKAGARIGYAGMSL